MHIKCKLKNSKKAVKEAREKKIKKLNKDQEKLDKSIEILKNRINKAVQQLTLKMDKERK